MNYIVFDLEWNQSSDPAGERKEIPFEIIEIGAVRMDESFHIIDQFSELIKPSVYPRMHHVTRKLIHLGMEDLKNREGFAAVFERFKTWCGEDPVFCTWGSLDLIELQRNMVYYGMSPISDRPFSFLDIQKLFSIAYEDRKSRRSLEYAVDYLQMEKDIPFHRAFGDAYYTAKVLQTMNRPEILANISFDTFVRPAGKDQEIHIRFATYAKYISREFASKESALRDREVCSTRCYLCGRSLRKKIRWFTPNGKHYISLSYCEEHGYMKGKIRIRKTETEKIFVVKTVKLISEEMAEQIREKKERAQQMHRMKKMQSEPSGKKWKNRSKKDTYQMQNG